MHCFYLEEQIIGDQAVIEAADQLHHLQHVLRLNTGDQITIFDPTGREYLCAISTITRQQAHLKVIETKAAHLSKIKLAIACAIPKKSGFDDIVDKLTQIGVDTIIPLLTDRVVVKSEEVQGLKLERWRKIARAAAEQSQRSRLPNIPGIKSLNDLLSESNLYNLKLIPTLEGNRRSLPEILAGKAPAAVLVLIGPEGDFTPQEVNQAVSAGFQPVSLGDNVLRVDTAAVVCASYLKLVLM